MPLTVLLNNALAGVRMDVPGSVGAAVCVGHSPPHPAAGRLRVLAANGVGRELTPVLTGQLWTSLPHTAEHAAPVLTADLWRDARWPRLTIDSVCGRLPAHEHGAVGAVTGMAVVTGVADQGDLVVLSVYLDRAADDRTLAALARHERLVTSALAIADAAARTADEAQRVLDALASRAVIEQAKGALIAQCRCDGEQAWAVLRRASQHFNVKLRELAVALVEHVGQAPVTQNGEPDGQRLAGPAAHRAAALVWRALGGST
jgi:hypothetical protein